jgi:intracellular sulfur oxidation DsrE/DsrF family protein
MTSAIVKRVSSLILFSLLLCVSASAYAQATAHRVVFALTSGDEADWKLTLGNIRNLIAALPVDSTEVEVVAYGPGINFVRKGSSADTEIQTLEAKHVRFVACENSMRMQKITLADLVTGVSSVPSGIVEVVTKQEHGWTYIKAGR